MIYPSASDVLKNLEHHFEQEIKPVLTGTPQETIAQTMGHLLRHARVRVEREGQLLMDESSRLRALMARAATWLANVGEEALAAELNQTASRSFRSEGQYPALDSLAAEVVALREVLYQAQKVLQSLRSKRGAEPGYRALREEFRAYMAWQVGAEAELVEEAFVGRGPRR
jgi:hypothetical protein